MISIYKHIDESWATKKEFLNDKTEFKYKYKLFARYIIVLIN
jgi:hypothetical protein